MYRILTASSDSYITNKIINNSFRATDANVGQAASLDLFKLYSESTSGSDASPTEVSRALVKFDLSPLRSLTGSILDISSSNSSFKCTLNLYDVYGGQTCPSNFKLIVFPLSRSFDEGIGRDIVTFADLDACNFISSSVSGDTAIAWNMSGANREGLLGSDNLDVISSGNLNDGNGVVNLWKDQTFSTGEENLSVDVTTIISATLKNLIPDYGFRISYSGSQETDKFTRFVKRFGSSQNSNFYNKPKLVVKFNDTIQDHHKSFYFNISGSLFLNNFHRGVAANILSGASVTQITGSNSLIVKLESGSRSRGNYFKKIITASQHKAGQNFMSGVYSASFAISEFTGSNVGEIRFTGSLASEIKNAGSATFTETWGSLDGNVGFLTSSIIINSVNRTSFKNNSPRILITVTNMKNEYRRDDKVRFDVFAEDIDRVIKFKKLPIEGQSNIFTSLYYRIRDIESGKIVIPFDKPDNSTLCSTDSDGMYFEVYMDSVPRGPLCTIDFLLRDQGVDQIFTDVSSRFKVI